MRARYGPRPGTSWLPPDAVQVFGVQSVAAARADAASIGIVSRNVASELFEIYEESGEVRS